MRNWTALCSLVLLLVVACAGPPSTGGLWAQQNVDQERALFKLTDSERAERMHAVELGLADEALQSERARITTELDACPGPPQALSASPGDRVRDGVRVRVQGDATRMGALAQVALADWRLRRARATGMQRFCQDAREALTTPPAVSQPTSSDLLGGLPAATVARDGPAATAPFESSTPAEALTMYALGYLDSVYAAAPLPQYLALVYGGFVVNIAEHPTVDDETAQQIVDREAPTYPQWEPDALYAALHQ